MFGVAHWHVRVHVRFAGYRGGALPFPLRLKKDIDCTIEALSERLGDVPADRPMTVQDR